MRASLAHIDALRDQFTKRIDEIRADMLSQVFASTTTVIRNQQSAIIISATVTALAATLGLGFALLGQTVPQTVYEVMGRRGELTNQQELLRTRYGEGLAAYRACNSQEAHNAFDAALKASPFDGPSRALLKRIDGLKSRPLQGDWDGSWKMEHKWLPAARGADVPTFR